MLNFIIGTAGSGKSYNLQHKLIDESIKNPDSRFVLLVPDQYSLEAQKEILDKHPRHGAFNIEVSSFNRLAYEVLDEMGFGEAKMMDELTKSILVRKALIDCSKDLKVYGGKISMPGFTEKVKSILDELGQYDIDDDRLNEIIEECEGTLQKKLKDVQIIRESFNKYVDKQNLTREELLDKFMNLMDGSDIIKNTYIYIDGFTGFTPIQEKVIGKLSEHAKDVTVTATMKPNETDELFALAEDKGLRPEDRKAKKEELLRDDDLFLLGKSTIYNLTSNANNVNEPKHINDENDKPYRIKDNEALSHLSQNIFRSRVEKYEEAQDSLEILEADSLEEEVLSVVKTISTMVRSKGYRYRDFAVITGDMESYYKYLAKLFKKYEIPVFIDYKRNTSENLFADLIIALIRLAEFDFNYQTLFHLLRLGVTGIPEDELDYIENYILTFRRTTFKSFAQEWKRKPKHSDYDLSKVNSIREKIYKLFKEYMSAVTKKDATVRDYCNAIYAFLDKIQVNKQIEKYVNDFREAKEYALEEEYSQIHSALIKLLEGLENTLGDEKLNLEEFEDLSLGAIEELKIGIIPPGIDDVMVADIERSRLKDIKRVIFLIGANDGVIPKVGNTATIINDTDRDVLRELGVNLAPTTRENVYKQMFYLYTMLSKPTEKFIVSYATRDKDANAIKQSYFVDMLQNILTKTEIKQISIKEDKVEDIINENVSYDYLAKSGLKRRRGKQTDDEIKIYNAIEDVLKKTDDRDSVRKFIRKGTFFKFKDATLSKQTADRLYENDKGIKINRVTNYINCPYNQFASSGLYLQERDKYELSSMESGNIEHGILESFFKEIVDKEIDLKNIEKDELDKILEECIEEEFESEERSEFFRTDPSRKFTKHQLSKMAKETVDILVDNLVNSEFKVFGVEEMKSGGKADRVDTCVDGENVYVKIIDYKTGDKEFNYGNVIHGTDMQVFVYLKDAMDMEREKLENSGKNIIPAGAFYFHVFNPYIKKTKSVDDSTREKTLAENHKKQYKMKGLVNEEHTDIVYSGNIGDVLTSPANNSLNTEYYDKLLNYTEKNMEEARQGIKDGNISIDPYDGSCEFCKFKGICRINTKLEDPKTFEKIDKEAVIKILDEEK